MTDDELLAEMRRLPARHAALDSRVRTALLAALRGDDAVYLTLLRLLLMDSHAAMPELLIAYGRVFCEMAIGSQGRELAEARIEEDIRIGQDDALKGLP